PASGSTRGREWPCSITRHATRKPVFGDNRRRRLDRRSPQDRRPRHRPLRGRAVLVGLPEGSSLKRGLGGVKLVISLSDAHEGLRNAITRVLGATWQRCRVHWMRSALSQVPKGQHKMV